jgi:hypothetical protein
LESADEANTGIGERDAKVYMKSGMIYEAQDLYIEKDSIRFYDTKSKSILRFSNHEIKSIDVNNHTIGLVYGLLIGGHSTTTFRFALTLGDPDWSYSEKGIKEIIILSSTIIGSVVGMTIGGVRGQRYSHILPQGSINTGTLTDSTDNSNK